MLNVYKLHLFFDEEPFGKVAKVLVVHIIISEFELQSYYYVHFRTLGKVLTPLSPKQWVE